MTKSHILGLANLTGGDNARDFILKSAKTGGEGGQAESHPLLRTFNMGNLSPTLKEDYRDNKKAFEALVDSEVYHEIDKDDRLKERKFKKAFKALEKEKITL